MKKIKLYVLAMMIMLAACKKTDVVTPPTDNELPPLTGTPTLVSKTLLTNRGIIWGFETLTDGRILFTEKSGGVFLFDSTANSVVPLNGLPADVQSGGQGGWLDVCMSPRFSENGLMYITYSITGNFLVLARFTLSGNTATDWQILHTTATPSTWGGHYGSRIRFGPDGKLYWSVGEGGTGSLGGAASFNQNAQSLNTLWGKVHRMNDDGTIPADNPVIAGVRSTIFSYGHRNPQGLCFNPVNGKLYETEHGPKGGCEVNVIEAGRNYGWPLYSEGINYDGSFISNGHNGAGITAPLQSFTPALAPAGLAFIQHRSYRDWNGRLLSGSLARKQLLMIQMQDGVAVRDTVLFDGIGRIRNVKQGPDGKILFSVEDGRLIQLEAN